MSRKRVYDLPTRVFHWVFAGCFLIAFTISNTADDEGAVFSYHMIAGMVLVFAVIWRIVWGVIGSPHARFTHFPLQPPALVDYLKNVLNGTTRLWSGHNPASSWAAIIMMLLALGLGITGYLMVSSPVGERFEDLHETLADSFLVIVLLHISGIVIHAARHHDPIHRSMIDGHKQHVPDTASSVSSHTAIGLLMLALSIGFGGYLLDNYNPGNQTLSIAGSNLQLTEFEDRAGESGHDGDDEESDD